MGSIPRVSVVTGERQPTPATPLSELIPDTDDVALVYNGESETKMTYAELNSRSKALSRAMCARAGDANADGDYVVAVCMQPTHNTVLTLLAAWRAGAAYVPMEPSFPQGRIQHILSDCSPALVVYDESANPALFTTSGIPSVSFEDLQLEASALSTEDLEPEEMLAEANGDTVAIVLYTSGSTGIPKGVRLTYSAICNRLYWQFATFPYADTENNCVWKTALTFVDSVCEMWGPLVNGRTLVILSRETTRDPQRLVKVLEDNQIHRLVLVPTLLRSILMYLSLKPSEKLLKNLKLWVCSGETLNKDLAAEFFKHFGETSGYKLANFYGSTEVMGDVTYYVIEKSGQLELFKTIPIGAPIDNSAIYLLDEEMSPVREGETGELWVSGRNLSAGYVGGQAPDKFCLNPHGRHLDFSRLYRTGDFGILQKGMVLYAGRTDSQVKIRGHRVDLQEVDRAVNAVKGVDKGVVLCYGVERGDPEILAYVTLQQDARMDGRHVEDALRKALTSYMIPQVIVIDSIPLLVNGKVDRQALLKMYENTNNNDDTTIPLDIDYTGVEPDQMEAAEALFHTVGEVLGRAARGVLSVRVGFYELGGNSLNSIFTITKLREKGFYIQITDFLSAANLGEVLAKLGRTQNDDEVEAKLVAEPMKDEHKDKVIEMIVSSFYEKAELEQFVKDEIASDDYARCIGACWPALLRARLSVVLTDSASNEPIAVALNFDARDEPEIELDGGLAKIMAFLEHVEGSVRDSMLPQGKGAILHSFMMATASHLSPRDNVSAIRALEHATVRVARDKRFKGVFTTNTSPLTQQLGRDVLGFQTLLDYQINQYEDSRGVKVFGRAPDDMRVIVCWKTVE